MAIKPATDFAENANYQYQVIQVIPKEDWDEETRTRVQKKDRISGMPLWTVDCIRSAYDEDAASISVTVASNVEPEISPMSPVHFSGLRGSFWSNKNGNAGIAWRAEDVAPTS